MNQRINLWASPRNISTALMYSFQARTDCEAIDEPFYASYLKTSGKVHPGQEAILKSQSTEFQTVVQQVILRQYSKPIVFFKQMSHHLPVVEQAFHSQCDNLILIRPPEHMINSFSKVIDQPTLDDLGLKRSFELMQYFEKYKIRYGIINSDLLLRNPKQALQKICSFLNIPFQEEMLSWPKGPKAIDGVWAPYWYAGVHQSEGFSKYEIKPLTVAEKYKSLLEACLPYYHQLNSKNII